MIGGALRRQSLLGFASQYTKRQRDAARSAASLWRFATALQQFLSKRNTIKILKGLQSNPFKIFIGSGLFAKQHWLSEAEAIQTW